MMHDPKVVVFDLHAPIPVKEGYRWPNAPKWGAKLRRYTDPDPDWHNKPVSPFRPEGWEVYVAGYSVRLYCFVTVWHDEPLGDDAGTACEGMGGSDLTWHNVKWAWNHRRHLQFQWHVLTKARKWYRDRCADCGHRFRYREGRVGYGWDSDETFHFPCLELKYARLQLDEAYAYIRGDEMSGTRNSGESKYCSQRADDRNEDE